MQTQRLYLYLASRSKRGIKLVTILKSEKIIAKSQITDLAEFGLPAIWEREIQRIIIENILLFEPIVESSPSYITLRTRLKDRGFTNIPMGITQIINLLQFGTPPKANVSSANVNKSMLRKRK